MGRWLRSSLGFFLVVASILGAYNVFADNADVERMAQQVACDAVTPPAKTPRAGAAPAAACSAAKTMMERTPISQTFELAVGNKRVKVRCMRSFVLVGDYACEVR
jgi:hypothetical protein